MMDVRCCECHLPFFFNHWDIKTCALNGNKMKTWICLTFSLSCFSLSLFTQTSRVPVGATVAHHNLNDLIMIHGIPLQQRNMGTLDRIAQYEHCRRNNTSFTNYKLYIYHCILVFWCCRNWSKLRSADIVFCLYSQQGMGENPLGPPIGKNKQTYNLQDIFQKLFYIS